MRTRSVRRRWSSPRCSGEGSRSPWGSKRFIPSRPRISTNGSIWAAFLTEHDIDLRAFALLGAPYVPAPESIEWTVRTVEYAAANGASRIAVIPVRAGNGELERLAALGHFVPPTLAQLETALECCLALTPAIVSVDLWDVERLPACEACRSERVARLRQLNLRGRAQPIPPVSCSVCA
jgi:hypothetical protein